MADGVDHESSQKDDKKERPKSPAPPALHLSAEAAEAPRARRDPSPASVDSATVKVSSRPTSRSTTPQTRSQGAARTAGQLEIALKCETQLERYGLLEEVAQQFRSTKDCSVELLSEYKSQVDELSVQLNADGSSLSLLWSPEVADVPYFKDKILAKAQRLALQLKRDIVHAKSQLAPTSARSQLSTAQQQDSRLPDISLPTFDGSYSQWPYFKDMFQSLIYKNPRLSSVQKLHYLRSCLSGEPAQIVSAYDLSDSSLEPAMRDLMELYNNKRLIVQSHLDKLLNLTPLTSKSAKGLGKLASTIAEVKQGLAALRVADQLGDMLLVHLIVCNIDRSTKESWETSIGASQDYPSSQQVEQFLRASARALERVEGDPSSSRGPGAAQSNVSKGAVPKRTAHTAFKPAQQQTPAQPAQAAPTSKTTAFA